MFSYLPVQFTCPPSSSSSSSRPGKRPQQYHPSSYDSHPYNPFSRVASTSTIDPLSLLFGRPSVATARHHHHEDPESASSDNDDSDDDMYSSCDEEHQYYEYLDAKRREQELKELADIQAKRRAQEEAAFLEAKRRKHAEVAAARARAQAEAEARAAAEYRARVQAEYRRRQALAQAQAQAEAEAEAARERAHAEAQAKAKARAEAIKRQQQQHQQRREHQEMQRRIQAAYEQDLARLILWQATMQQQQRTSTPPPRASTPVAVRPVNDTPATSTQKPAVVPLPSSSDPSRSTSPTMDYTSAVHLVQNLAKQQIAVRRSLKSVGAVREKFESLKSELQDLPKSLAFDTTKSLESDSPVLQYSARNLPFRKYEESLTQLLTSLDEISSKGSERVKSERKNLVLEIENELSRLDAHKINVWLKVKQQLEADQQASDKQPTEEEDASMEVAQPAEESTSAADEVPAMDTDAATTNLSPAPEPYDTPAADTAAPSDHVEQASEPVNAFVGSVPAKDEVMHVDEEPVEYVQDVAATPTSEDNANASSEEAEVAALLLSSSPPVHHEYPDATNPDAPASVDIGAGKVDDSLSPARVTSGQAMEVEQEGDQPQEDAAATPPEFSSSATLTQATTDDPTAVNTPRDTPQLDSASAGELSKEAVDSVSASKLPLPLPPQFSTLAGALDALSKDLQAYVEDDDQDHDHASNSSSDTSFEML